MTVSLDVLIEDDKWQTAGIDAIAAVACTATVERVLGQSEVEISVLACNDNRIAALNADFRGKAVPTNVLSWPSVDRAAKDDGDTPDLTLGPDPELGDIAIAYGVCQSEARAAGRSLEDHATHLLVHGTLHLLGFDHERDADATLMESLETEILGKLGVADPYRVD